MPPGIGRQQRSDPLPLRIREHPISRTRRPHPTRLPRTSRCIWETRPRGTRPFFPPFPDTCRPSRSRSGSRVEGKEVAQQLPEGAAGVLSRSLDARRRKEIIGHRGVGENRCSYTFRPGLFPRPPSAQRWPARARHLRSRTRRNNPDRRGFSEGVDRAERATSRR